jgi:hypothetical protein
MATNWFGGAATSQSGESALSGGESRLVIGLGGCGRVVEVVEFGADLVGVGVVEFVEDGQGLLPGVPPRLSSPRVAAARRPTGRLRRPNRTRPFLTRPTGTSTLSSALTG